MKKRTKYLLSSALATTTTFFTGLTAHAEGDGGSLLPGVEPLKNDLLSLLGTVFILFLAWGAFKNYTTQAYGKMASLIGGSVLVAWIVYYPDNFIGFLKRIVDFFTQV